MAQTVSKGQLIDWLENNIKPDAVINFSLDDNITYEKDKRFHSYKISIFAANIFEADRVQKPKGFRSIINYSDDELRVEEEKAQNHLSNIFSEWGRRKGRYD